MASVLPPEVFSDSINRVQLAQCQTVWPVRSIDARLRVQVGRRLGLGFSCSLLTAEAGWSLFEPVGAMT